jgi:hypothetical protein
LIFLRFHHIGGLRNLTLPEELLRCSLCGYSIYIVHRPGSPHSPTTSLVYLHSYRMTSHTPIGHHPIGKPPVDVPLIQSPPIESRPLDLKTRITSYSTTSY